MVYGTHRAYADAKGSFSSFRDLDLCVEASCRTLEKRADEFDFILVTGISGLSVGAPVALAVKKNLLVLRKSTESCHDEPGRMLGSSDLDEGSRVLFFDDFISRGSTFDRCVAAMGSQKGTIVGTYEYRDDRYLPRRP